MNKLTLIATALQHPVQFIIDGFKGAEELKRKKYLRKKYRLEQLPTIDLLDLLPDLNESIDNYSFLTGTSLVTDILLLKGLARKFPSCSYLEIGTWRGESLVNVADVTDDCTAVTLSDQEMKAMGLTEEYIRLHACFSKYKTNIQTHYQNSQTFDFQGLNKKFDLVFIDGDHTYKGVLNDSQKVFPLLRDEHSMIVWHDYGFSTEEVRYSVLAAILDGIPAAAQGNLFHVSNTMCAIYTSEKFATTLVRFPSVPNKKFFVEVKADKR